MNIDIIENWEIFIIGNKKKLIVIKDILDKCYENMDTLPYDTQVKTKELKKQIYSEIEREGQDYNSEFFRFHIFYNGNGIDESCVVENLLDQIGMMVKGIDFYIYNKYSDRFHENRKLYAHIKTGKNFPGTSELSCYTTRPHFEKKCWMPDEWFNNVERDN